MSSIMSKASNWSNSSFSTASTSVSIASCKTCGEVLNQPEAFVQKPFYCSQQCEKLPVGFPKSKIKTYSTMNILQNGIEVFKGDKSAEFEAEFKLRSRFLRAWADSPEDLTIYTMDSAPFRDMLEHEDISNWPNPRACHREALNQAYNMAHHDECYGLYMQAYTSLLGSILRIFLMWDLTQLGIARSKLAGLCMDMDSNTMLRGEDVISIPEELLDTEALQVAWFWPGAIEKAILHSAGEASVIAARGKNDHLGTFDFDRSHWKTAIKVIRKVSGSCWED